MSKKMIRKTKIDKFIQILIDSGKFVVDASNPLSACEKALEQIEQRNEDKFIDSVLNDINSADVESLDAVKSLKRLYRATQAIHKATTQEKINRFKKLTVSGIINQNNLSDDNFELFVNIIDDLTDTEYLIMSIINRIEEEHKGEKFDTRVSKETEKQILAELSMDNHTFISYITRLKGKGMIIPPILSPLMSSDEAKELFGDMMLTSGCNFIADYEKFCINNVNGHVSILFKKLLEYIN